MSIRNNKIVCNNVFTEVFEWILEDSAELEQFYDFKQFNLVEKQKVVSHGKYRSHTVFKAYHNSSSEQIVKNSATVTY